MTDSANDVTDQPSYDQKNVINSTKSRLIDAMHMAWADFPADAVSVRTIVRMAEAAQSSIHYHFGSLERLYSDASHAALGAAQHWMEGQLAQLGPLRDAELPAKLQASIIASIIAEWTGPQRRLAMAWRHAPDARWQAAWEGFWHEVAKAIGLGDNAPTIACFAAGEAARHLLAWRPALDRALLEETVGSLTFQLHGHQTGPDVIRPAYRALINRSHGAPQPPPDTAAAAIAAAAATLLAEKGHAGVTYRAVAARSEVTLGKVIHVYGTKSALLHAALHGLYEREALRGNPESVLARRVAPAQMLSQVIEAVIGGQQPVLLAYEEIERAIYNGEEHAALRGLVRAMDDPSGSWALQQLRGGAVPSASLVAGFSATIRGIGYRASHGGYSHDAMRTFAQMALESFMR